MGRLLSLFFLLLSFAAAAQAPQQKGIVKTRGRLVNGKVVRGQGIPNAIIQLEERDVQSQAKDGSFSFPVRNGRFRVNGVTKKGYQLLDQQTCREYAYSRDTLYLVMEAPEQQLADQLAQERKLRRDLQRRLQQREDEIEALNLSIEEKNRLLMEIDQEREDNEKIIKDLSAYYAALDYDQLDAFQQQVSACLENGELDKADSLLRSRGRMEDRIRSVMGEQAAEAREEAELDQRREALDRSKSGTRRKLEDIAADCYSYYRRYLVSHQNDSCFYYLDLRASLDTLNLQWQNDAGVFCMDYLGEYDRALGYFQRMERNALSEDDTDWLLIAYQHIGFLQRIHGNYEESIRYYQEELTIGEKEQILKRVADALSGLGSVSYDKGDISLAMDYYQKALLLYDHLGVRASEAMVYNNLGLLFLEQGDFDRSLDYSQKALLICEELYGKEHPDYASYLESIGAKYLDEGDYTSALTIFREVLSIRSSLFDSLHPDITETYFQIGKVYLFEGEYDLALENFQKSLSNRNSYIQEARLYEFMGLVYYYKEDYLQALEEFEKALEMRIRILGPEVIDVAFSYQNIACVKKELGRFEEALQDGQRAKKMMVDSFGDNSHYVAAMYYDLGDIYFRMKNYSEALECMLKAQSIARQLTGDFQRERASLEKTIIELEKALTE